jgi:hypothetical protein
MGRDLSPLNLRVLPVFSARARPGSGAMLRTVMRLTGRFSRGLSSMPVQAESLEVLEQAAVAPAQARAFVRAIEIEIAAAKDRLATQHDLLALRTDLRGEMAALRTDLRGEMAALRTELRGEMDTLGAELRGELDTLGTQLRGAMAEQGAALCGELSKLGAELRAELHGSIGGVIRQMYLAILGQMAVLLGFSYFFATHLS